jgi:UDP-N-acetylglucosamine diphosphorylase / glucose-1-phosphate thymidylyltransferase / UDP-N-acetylgalactosamine diphosphorylase / glucosamine-1-phosphate N-acetyltransferase / galactosamine-1-phosphate N-acetyltransferase
MIRFSDYITRFAGYFPLQKDLPPWQFVAQLQEHLTAMLPNLGPAYRIQENIAIHESSVIEAGVVLKGPLIISPNCFVGAHAYFRGGVFLGTNVSIGPGCEIKSSAILAGSRLAHFNFVGDSVIGSDVNLEAGSVLANYHNDREDKTIWVRDGNEYFVTEATKFGALVGDHSRIGANAVCGPGTLLAPHSIVRRLELIEQDRGRRQPPS